MIDKKSFPLQWPVGYKRTPVSDRVRSRFSQTFDRAQRSLHLEVERLRATDLVVSTNLRYRNDGMLYASEMGRKIDDPGVAIYFKYKGNQVSMCCDKYLLIWENIFALAMGIEAIRGMERWGVSEFLDRAFTGFTAIPEKSGMTSWWAILEIEETSDERKIIDAFHRLAKIHHPDRLGDKDKYVAVVDAYEAAIKIARSKNNFAS